MRDVKGRRHEKRIDRGFSLFVPFTLSAYRKRIREREKKEGPFPKGCTSRALRSERERSKYVPRQASTCPPSRWILLCYLLHIQVFLSAFLLGSQLTRRVVDAASGFSLLTSASGFTLPLLVPRLLGITALACCRPGRRSSCIFFSVCFFT